MGTAARPGSDLVIDGTPFDGPAPTRRRSDRWADITARLPELPFAAQRALATVLAGETQEPYRQASERATELSAGAPPSGTPHLADHFRSEPIPKRPGAMPETEAVDPVPVEKVARILGPGGEFAQSLGNYEHREGQVSMARAVTEALNSERHIMAEGGTGIGKGLAYLIPAILWAEANGTPVVISTNTKNLQAQLFEKDIPLIRRMLGIPFKAALIKGRMNYVCLRKLLAAIDAPDEIPDSHRTHMAEILYWVLDSATGDLSECPNWNPSVAATLGSTLTATGEECLGRGCRYARKCFLMRARGKSLTSDIVVANHALVFAEMALLSPALPPYRHIVFDEAHNLEEAATRHFSVELSSPRFKFELGRLYRSAPRRDGFGVIPGILRQSQSGSLPGSVEEHKAVSRQCWAVIDALHRVDDRLPALFKALTGLFAGRETTRRFGPDDQAGPEWDAVDRAREEITKQLQLANTEIQHLVHAVKCLEGEGLPFHLEAAHDLEGASARITELLNDMHFVLRAEEPDSVYWVETAERRQGGTRAWAAPIDVGRRLADDLYSQKSTVVFTSATLSVAGSYKFLKKRIGLEHLPPDALQEISAASPFDYSRQCAVMLPQFVDDPTSGGDRYAEELGFLLADVFRRTQGRGMALFTSYAMLRETTRVVESELNGTGIQVLAQGKSGSREAITRAFTDDVESVLLGTHSFWEGVDAVGETLTCLVVARLPFAVYTDPIIAARCERIEQQGGNAFMEFSLPNAVIRFRQGFGRLIRHRQDRGVVIIADRRIVTKRYGGWFRRSLPTSSIPIATREQLLDAVDEFLARS